MSTTPSATGTIATATITKQSFFQKLGAWFHKEAVVVEQDIKAIISGPEVTALEAGFTALAKTELGMLATEAVTAASDLNTGKVNFSQAAASLLANAKAAGKTLTDSTVTTLIAAAQQKLQSVTKIVTTPGA
jgi:hypothetical protein